MVVFQKYNLKGFYPMKLTLGVRIFVAAAFLSGIQNGLATQQDLSFEEEITQLTASLIQADTYDWHCVATSLSHIIKRAFPYHGLGKLLAETASMTSTEDIVQRLKLYAPVMGRIARCNVDDALIDTARNVIAQLVGRQGHGEQCPHIYIIQDPDSTPVLKGAVVGSIVTAIILVILYT